MGVGFDARRVCVAAGGNREQAARRARYAAWRELLRPGDLLALAHHADDQAETRLWQLLTGREPGGMPVERRLGGATPTRRRGGASARSCGPRERRGVRAFHRGTLRRSVACARQQRRHPQRHVRWSRRAPIRTRWRRDSLADQLLRRLPPHPGAAAPVDPGRARQRRCAAGVASHQHVRARNVQLFESTGHRDSWDAYGASKLAMVHMSMELHRRHGATGDFRAVALHPGTVFTNMIADGFASDPRLRILRPVLHRLARRVLLTPAAGAQTVLWCATAQGVQGGRYYERCAPARPSPAVLDEDVGARLWEASARWTDS